MSSKKYKDERPMNTVNKIKGILNSMGFYPKETMWKNSVKNYYSLSVMIEGTNISTNGKGTTKEYALASAYAELMERIQNQTFFRLNTDLSSSSYRYMNFYYTPDEKYMSIDALLNDNNEWIKTQFCNMKKDIDKKYILEKWRHISFEKVNCDFVCIPYVNLMTNNTSHIPIKMLAKMYMSNGMCAGNTKEEALVQGLSEVFERASNKEVVLKKLTPPTIPQSYIAKFPRVYNMIKNIKELGNYNIIVKDCSLDKGYPVLAVIFINRDNQTYFVKFGSHPVFEIALERCLTELLQGQSIFNMQGVKEFSYNQLIEDENENLLGILVNGSGYYPTELFLDKPSYEFSEFDDLSNYNNKELLKYMLDLLDSKNHEVYVRDVSFLGFPSYSIIVPNLSEIDKIDDIQSIDLYINYVKIKRRIRKLQFIADCEIEKLIDLLVEGNMNGPVSVMKCIGLDTSGNFAWYYNDMNLFISALYYKLGDFSNSHKYFCYYLNTSMVNNSNMYLYTYYKCVRDYIAAKSDNLDDDIIIKRLRNFYSVNTIKKAMSEFADNDIFKQFGLMRCWDCKNCEFYKNCNYPNIDKAYRVLKYQCSMNNPTQDDLKYTYCR